MSDVCEGPRGVGKVHYNIPAALREHFSREFPSLHSASLTLTNLLPLFGANHSLPTDTFFQ